ncbi:MAG: Tfp pilus assembly protein FimT/FimU [Phycisphaerales bacterium JB043]
MRTQHPASRRAFTFIDVLVTIAVMLVIAALALPAMSSGTQINISGASSMLASDLEYTQSLSLANPQNPALIKFDPANDTYWIAFASDPDAPIVRPGTDSEPYSIVFGQGLATAFAGITIDTSDITADSIAFDSYGRPFDPLDNSITLTSMTGRSITLLIDSNTGFVSIQ